MVGSAINLAAKREGHAISGKSSKSLNLTNRKLVFEELKSSTVQRRKKLFLLDIII